MMRASRVSPVDGRLVRDPHDQPYRRTAAGATASASKPNAACNRSSAVPPCVP